MLAFIISCEPKVIDQKNKKSNNQSNIRDIVREVQVPLSMKIENPKLYKLLPPIYREFIYELRGTVFRNKKLTFNNVYRLLKKTNSYKIISMIGQHTVLRTNLLKNNININLNINNV